MRTAYAVIGAHYGDEGKGQVTAWLCRRLKEEHPEAKVLNVLTNGGCQRGHTVHIAGDKDFRHVFKHFGSGTPYGAHTHFGPEFILNPMQFVKEDEELSKAGFKPVCFCGYHNRVQLPVDMAVNQYLEKERYEKGSAHGSVGFGINETILRYERGKGMSFGDMLQEARDGYDAFVRRLSELSRNHAADRITEELGYEKVSEFMSKFYDFLVDGTLQHFVDDLLSMAVRVRLGWPSEPSFCHDFFVFENGQGLKIGQQEAKNFFHCTPSDTGAFSVLRAMYDMELIGDKATEKTKVGKVTPVYVSRTYMTRHGAGPFSVPETKNPPFEENPDETNRPNDFQGSIRYAKFSGGWDFHAMEDDLKRFRETCIPQCDVQPVIAATHVVGYDAKEGLQFFPWLPNVMFSTDQTIEASCDKTDIF